MVRNLQRGKTHEEAAVFTANGQLTFTPSASWADGSYPVSRCGRKDLAGNVKNLRR